MAVDLVYLEEKDCGHSAWRIEAAEWTWVFHREGGAVAHLHDPDGDDWIAWSPKPGAEGAFRGLGNLVHVDLKTGYFHPGNTGTNGCHSEIVTAEPDRLQIRSRSADALWTCETTVRREGLCIRLTDTPGIPWWFLYEGTPGGVWEPATSQWLRSDGEAGTLKERWHADLPDRSWVAFTDPVGTRSLALWQEKGERRPDMYLPMSLMTVFGFGRYPDILDKYCRRVGQAYLAVPVDSAEREDIDRAVYRAVAAFDL
ncbi:MAG: hypothetical protein ACFE0O_06375 [Opitutales bacterium]